MVNSTAAAAALRERVDLLFQPPIAGLDLLDWRALDRGVEVGYRHARQKLRAEDAPEWVREDELKRLACTNSDLGSVMGSLPRKPNSWGVATSSTGRLRSTR